MTKQETRKVELEMFEIEMFETEILDLKGEMRDQAMQKYHRLLKDQDKPIYLKRSDE